MGDEQETPWERLEGEDTLWYERFLLYLRMGPSRKLLRAVHEEEAQKSPEKPGSLSTPGAWKDAAKQWNWKARADAYDDYRRKQVFTTGNAYDVTRVEKLNKYSERLEAEIDKMLDALPKKIKKAWFNHFLYEKYLQSLAALAEETGGRIKTTKQEVSGSVEFESVKESLLAKLAALAGAEEEHGTEDTTITDEL